MPCHTDSRKIEQQPLKLSKNSTFFSHKTPLTTIDICNFAHNMRQDNKTNQFNVLAEKPIGSLLMQYAIPAIVAMRPHRYTTSSTAFLLDKVWVLKQSWDWL